VAKKKGQTSVSALFFCAFVPLWLKDIPKKMFRKSDLLEQVPKNKKACDYCHRLSNPQSPTFSPFLLSFFS